MSEPQWLGLIVGILIGAIFGWLQLLALQRNERLQRQQQPLPGPWRQAPGSMARIGFLLAALVLVEVFLPDINKWWVTGGLLAAYSIPFIWRLV